MRLSNLSRLLIICLCPFAFAGCPKMPPITTCFYDKPRGLGHCIGRDDKEFSCAFTKEAVEANPGILECEDKLVMVPFQDFGIVLDYCSAMKKK